MSKLDYYLTDNSEYENSLVADPDVAAMLENVRDLSGEPLWKLAEEVLGADVISDMLLERMSDWEYDHFMRAAKAAGVKL